MKIVKVMICFFAILAIPVVVTHISLSRVESNCINQEIQNGESVEFAKYVCQDI